MAELIPPVADKEQQVSRKDNDGPFEEVPAVTTSPFRDDFVGELDVSAPASAEAAMRDVEGLPSGSALLIVTRGPNVGSRFLLDQPVTSAGRHPRSSIFLDDITVSRRHAEFQRQKDQFRVVDVGSLNGTYVNRQPVGSAVLVNRDEIQIGKFRLIFLNRPAPS